MIIQVLSHKRDGFELTKEEINYFVSGYCAGEIPDYQIAALLMAIYIRGLSKQEIFWLTEAMMNSGQIIDLSPLGGIMVDKHSTGGVADTTSIALIPLIGAAGVRIAMMSGRGLGHTGGTTDKLSSIPGMRVEFSPEEMLDLVRKAGVTTVEQTKDLVVADKLIFSLRDVTATTSSIGLIASSIMSKKLAGGSDRMVIDVKTGSGAFMSERKDAEELGHIMVQIGENFGKRTVVFITNMEQPLGTRIGNSLEIQEAIRVLSGEAKGDLVDLCLYLGAELLIQADLASTHEEAKKILQQKIQNGEALEKFEEMIEAQGGDKRVVMQPDLLPSTDISAMIPARDSGYIYQIETKMLGQCLVGLGVGRKKVGDTIDPAVGAILYKRLGDHVEKGEAIGEIRGRDEKTAKMFADEVSTFYKVSSEKPTLHPLILARIDADGIHKLD